MPLRFPPETPLEYHQLVEQLRACCGLTCTPIPEIVLQAERDYLRLKKLVLAASLAGEVDKDIATLNEQLRVALYRVRSLIIANKVDCVIDYH